MTIPADLDAIACAQGGVVARVRLSSHGWSGSRIDRAAHRGHLLAVAPGIYRIAGAPWARRSAQHTAALLATPGGAISHWSAAALHGFADPRGGPIDITIPHRRRAPAAPAGLVRTRRSRRLTPTDIVHLDGLPVTTGRLTLLHLAAFTGVDRPIETAAAGLRSGACSLADLHEVLADHPAADGRDRFRRALDLLGDDGPDARSDVEVAALHAMVDAGLWRPVLAYRLRDGRGRFVAELDLAYPDQRIAIEVDGYRWHSTPARRRDDERRQNRIVLTGWTVLRLSASDVRHRPAEVVAAVRAALLAAGTAVA